MVDCPGFGDILLQYWFPHTDNIRFVFACNTDTQLFKLQNTEISKPHQASTGPYGGGDCITNKSFNAVEKDRANISLCTLDNYADCFTASGLCLKR